MDTRRPPVLRTQVEVINLCPQRCCRSGPFPLERRTLAGHSAFQRSKCCNCPSANEFPGDTFVGRNFRTPVQQSPDLALSSSENCSPFSCPRRDFVGKFVDFCSPDSARGWSGVLSW